jgi:hypothetical protein
MAANLLRDHRSIEPAGYGANVATDFTLLQAECFRRRKTADSRLRACRSE